MPSFLKLSSIRTLLLIGVFAASLILPNVLHASTGSGPCGGTETQVSILPNPYTPNTSMYNLWQSLYGSNQTITGQTFATAGEDGCAPGSVPTPTPVVAIHANPTSIVQGSSSQLSWSTSNATACSIDNGVGTVASNAPGSTTVTPNNTTTYTLTCADNDGAGSYTAPATVTVTSKPVQSAPNTSITASPNSIPIGSTTTLTYNSTNSTACSIDNGVGAVTPNVEKSLVVGLTKDTVYTLTCSGLGGVSSSNVLVHVTQPNVTGLITTSPNPCPTPAGKPSCALHVFWSSTASDAVVYMDVDGLPQDLFAGGASGDLETGIQPVPRYYDYYLYDNSSGKKGALLSTVRATATAPKPGAPIVSITATPDTIVRQSSSILSWSSQGATSCSIDNNIGSVTPNEVGQRTIYPPTTTQYIFTCTGPGGTSTASVVVIVTEAPHTGTITASPNPCSINNVSTFCSTQLTWSVSGLSVTKAAVYAQSSSGAEQLYSNSLSGFQPADFIPADPDYVNFILYDYSDGARGNVLSQVRVSGQKAGPDLPDLTVFADFPSGGSQNESVRVGGIVRNKGLGDAARFPNIVQVCADGGNCDQYQHIFAADDNSRLPANTYDPLWGTITAPADIGTYSYRFCANTTTSWDNVVKESDYGNNCGEWAKLTVTKGVTPIPPAPSGSCTLSANPTSIFKGDTSTLTWDSTNEDSCTGTNFSTSGAKSGSVSVSPTSDQDYALTCTGASGICNATPVTVAVGGCSGTPTPSITASSKLIAQGSSVKLSFSGAHVSSSCELTSPAGTLMSYPANSCTVDSKSYTATNLQSQTKFCFACDGGTPACVTVNVAPKFQNF
jgi:hypothetical protein